MTVRLEVRTRSAMAALALVRKLRATARLTKVVEGFGVAIPLTLETRLDLPEQIDDWARSLVEKPEVRLIVR